MISVMRGRAETMRYVLIVDDQRMPRENMERAIADSEGYELVMSLATAEFAPLQCEREHIDLVLMDVCTDGVMDGIEAAAAIKKKTPHVKVIIVTSMVEESYLRRARKAGADSFWYKDISRESLMEVIDRTMAGEHLFPDAPPPVKIGMADSADLTPTEIKVLRLICEGLEYSEIAERLGTKVGTTKTHVARILAKTGYANKTRLAIAATKKNFIIPRLPEEQEDV